MTVRIPCFVTLRRDRLHFFRRAEHCMGMPVLSPSMRWTAAMVRELPDDGNRYECIDVEIAPDTLVQPDVFVVPRDPSGGLPREWHDIRTLLLVIEVLSPIGFIWSPRNTPPCRHCLQMRC